MRSQAASLEQIGVSVGVLDIRGYRGAREYWDAAKRVIRLNRRLDYDLVHAHYGHSGVIGRLQFRAPLILSYLGSDLLGKRDLDGKVTQRGRTEVTIFRQLARVAAATTTKSEEMERVLPTSCRARNTVIPDGVDLSRFGGSSKAEARKALDWPADEPTVIFVGDPEKPWKNFPLAEAAVNRLRERVPAVRLRVAWEVAPEDIPTWMTAADVVLSTSQYEGSQNVVKEAMASRRPMVATPAGDAPERLRGIAGCHVCSPAPEALAEGLAQALVHDDLPEARKAVESLAMEPIARRIVAVYEEVLDRRSTGR